MIMATNSEEVEANKDCGESAGEETSKAASDAALDNKSDAEKSDTDASSKDAKDSEDASEGDTKDEDKAEDGETSEEEKSEGAPEAYADFVIPEGTTINEDRLGRFQELAKTNNLPQDVAQKLVDLGAETLEEAATLQQEQWDKIKTEWRKTTESDKDMRGSDGTAKEAIAAAAAAVKSVGGKELQEALDLTGAGNHPAVVKAFYTISKAMADDTVLFGSGAGEELSAAEKLYPSMRNKK
jgi:hypothetical protein